MNVLNKLMDMVGRLKQDGCNFETDKSDDELLGEAAFIIGALQSRFPQEQEDDNCPISIERRKDIINAYKAAMNSKEPIAQLEYLAALVYDTIHQLKGSDK